LGSIGQIIAFDKWVPLVNAPVLGNLCELRHKSYIAEKLDSLDYIIVTDNVGLSATYLT